MYHQLILFTIKYCTGGTELSSLYLYSDSRGSTTASRDTSAALPLRIQTAIVKSSICLSTIKAGYCFDILRNETRDRQVKRTLRPLVGPSLSECACPLLTFVFEFELCT